MKLITNVKSDTKPKEIDDTSSSTTVFRRKNIKETTEKDPVFGTEKTVYIYDEEQYTFQEWTKIVTDNNRTNNKLTQDQVDITQLAVYEVIDIISGITGASQPMMLAVNDIEDRASSKPKKYIGITLLYTSLVNRGLITIKEVPETFKADVKEQLVHKLKE